MERVSEPSPNATSARGDIDYPLRGGWLESPQGRRDANLWLGSPFEIGKCSQWDEKVSTAVLAELSEDSP